MGNRLLSGVWRILLPIPPGLWEGQILKKRDEIAARQQLMPADHRRVHHLVVTELPRQGRPLPPEFIAAALDLPTERVTGILDWLEKRLTFLFRDSGGAVEWAYPVTVAKTPHRITFSSGETLYRRKAHSLRGGYFTPAQVAFVNRNIQSALFGF